MENTSGKLQYTFFPAGYDFEIRRSAVWAKRPQFPLETGPHVQSQEENKMAVSLTRFSSFRIFNVGYVGQCNLPSVRMLVIVRGVSSLAVALKGVKVVAASQSSSSDLSGFRVVFLPPSQTTLASNFHTTRVAAVREINRRALKMEQSRARSAELLKKLRKKRLEGLTKPDPKLSYPEKVVKRIERLPSIKSLVIFYWVQIKSKKPLTPLHKFTILERIMKFFSKDTQMRDVFLVHEAQQKCFQMLVQDIRANASAYDAQELCKIAVYMARLRVTDAFIYQGLETEIATRCSLSEYSSKQLSLLSWAFAKHHLKLDHIFQALDEEIFSRDLSEFTSAELCSIVWSFAEYGVPDTRQFYIKMGSEILTRNLSQFEPWMLASFGLAYSRVESFSSKVFKVLEEELFQRGELKPFDTNDLVMLVLAFGRNGNLHPKLFRKIETVMVRRRDFSETVNREHLEEMYCLLKNGQYHLAEVVKMIELVLYPNRFNSVFDALYTPRRAWQEKVLHQSLFKAY